MRRFSFKSTLLIILALIAALSLSKIYAAKIRGAIVALLWSADPSPPDQQELSRLQLENKLLKNELNTLREHFGNDLGYIFYMDFDLVPAKVIFRSPATWDSALWINVGKATNAQLGREVVLHNSPVVVGKSVVGIIDYVGEKQSRVRLITDSGLTPAVRAVRKTGLVTHKLAKGELHGRSRPLWRSHEHLLRGVGFNYDFADEEGPARDLRSPILKVGDLLVTTGLDGVFPPGLQVGNVTKIFPLKEGDYYYELEALPTAGDLDELSYMFVLKPLGYESEDRPPALGW